MREADGPSSAGRPVSDFCPNPPATAKSLKKIVNPMAGLFNTKNMPLRGMGFQPIPVQRRSSFREMQRWWRRFHLRSAAWWMIERYAIFSSTAGDLISLHCSGRQNPSPDTFPRAFQLIRFQGLPAIKK